MKNLRFICAQPAIPYYTWQVEVMLNNFLEMGVNLNQVDIVCSKNDDVIPLPWIKLAHRYPARFFFYDDLRETKNYISSIRPNILYQHFLRFPELSNDVIFYHDCDILFTRPIHEWITDEMINDKYWYGSDTKWYISYSYIKSKGYDVFNKMCDIMKIDPNLIIDNEDNSIGAQYIMKDVDFRFWKRVEMDSELLFRDVTELNRLKKQLDPSYHELQIWCADMWALLWNSWKDGVETICSDNLQFSWGTSTETEYNKYNIFHNAGVTTDETGLFYKAKYMTELPYNKDLQITPNTTSHKYYEWIKKVEKTSVLI